jgi:uncharacterized protein YggU (UPF0235/DUF167 family)
VPAWARDVPGGCELDLLVQPRASRTRAAGEHDGRLKVQLAAPPVDGEANAALGAILERLEPGLPPRGVPRAVPRGAA